MFEVKENLGRGGAKIKVVGVGGGGCNAVNTMIRSGLTGVEYIVANTDAQALNISLASKKIQLGAEVTKGLGAGANPDVGRKAAIEDHDKLTEILQGADMVFVTAGMGGGTGTGAAPVIAKLCKELGILTVGVITKPFAFEGKKRLRHAEQGISQLEESVDSLICIPNQRLLQIAGENLSLVETFKKADEVLLNAVQGISDLINNTGHINADFADVATVMANKGLALMGTGLAQGPNRAIEAAKMAVSSPLLEDITIDGATGIIINITGSSALTMNETNQAVSFIMEAADEDAEIIFGTVIDDSIGDMIKVTVIATGLNVTKAQQSYAAVKPSKVQAFVSDEKIAEAIQAQVKPEIFQENVYDRPAIHVAQEPTERLTENQTRPKFNLAQSLKEAAHKYESKKQHLAFDEAEEAPVAASLPQITLPQSAIQSPEGNASMMNATTQSQIISQAPAPSAFKDTKTKSIAEKLGFMNFDEDEFDTPSFMKKERGGEANL